MHKLSSLAERTVKGHDALQLNPPRNRLIRDALAVREAIRTDTGALAAWHPAGQTGRIPQDTYTVDHGDDDGIDWGQANNRRMDPQAFDALFARAMSALAGEDAVYVTDRTLGAEPRYAMPVRTMTGSPLTALFTDTMFRPSNTRTHDTDLPPFTILAVPGHRLPTAGLETHLRSENGRPVDMVVAMDFRRRAAVIFGTRYLGAVKKAAFTMMNWLLPREGVLPLHCSAVVDERGATHVLLGLSGTGKTTLSSDPRLTLIGDDEHLWSEAGIANMEYGCYAKLARLSYNNEPAIHRATFGLPDDGVLIENAMVRPDGSVDCDDMRLTENSRSAFRLSRLPNIAPACRGGHPASIVFLTCDARGVLPPVAKLTPRQALQWFALGYTSKVAGTETGITEPVSSFSRFFGGAFMPRPSRDYLNLFEQRLHKHGSEVYLVNTGWTGGPYGLGRRMDISSTRALTHAVFSGALRDVRYTKEQHFGLLIPSECPGVNSALLDPRGTWADPKHYDRVAGELATELELRWREHD